MTNEQLTRFIQEIIEEKNLAVSPEVKEQLVSDMSQKLLDLMERELVASLSEENIERLNQLLDENANDADIQQFIVSNTANADQTIAAVASRFRQAYLGAGR